MIYGMYFVALVNGLVSDVGQKLMMIGIKITTIDH